VHWELTESDQQLSEEAGSNGHKPHYRGSREREAAVEQLLENLHLNRILDIYGEQSSAYPDAHGSGERGIARVAGSASSVESLWVWFIQDGSELQPPWEIRVGQKRSAICNSVGMPGP
jgi:hypothetical protein